MNWLHVPRRLSLSNVRFLRDAHTAPLAIRRMSSFKRCFGWTPKVDVEEGMDNIMEKEKKLEVVVEQKWDIFEFEVKTFWAWNILMWPKYFKIVAEAWYYCKKWHVQLIIQLSLYDVTPLIYNSLSTLLINYYHIQIRVNKTISQHLITNCLLPNPGSFRRLLRRSHARPLFTLVIQYIHATILTSILTSSPIQIHVRHLQELRKLHAPRSAHGLLPHGQHSFRMNSHCTY